MSVAYRSALLTTTVLLLCACEGASSLGGNASSSDATDLGFGQLSVSEFELYGGLTNAREAKQVAHYIGRTSGDPSQVQIPMRSYVASCQTDTDNPRLFVSLSVASDTNTYGSVYEAEYDPQTQSLQPTSNRALLNQCHESHGIAVSSDCSRVAVLCSKDHKASDDEPYVKDLVADDGGSWMNMENNHDKIDNRIENDIGLMVSTNHSKYIGFLTDHPQLSIDDFLPDLKAQFPDTTFDESFDFTSMKGNEWEEEMAYLINTLMSDSDRADFHDYIRANGYRHGGQLWLLEWNDNAPLSEDPDGYIVNKMVDSPTGGDIDAGAKELIYTEDDKNGPSYAFSTTTKVFDGYGDTHTSGGLFVVERDTWTMYTNQRGWHWACGYGHVLNIRAFYNPYNQNYAALCTSDWNTYFGNTFGSLGTIAIKPESSGTYFEGYSNYWVPADATVTTNGGGHTVLPIDEDTNLSVIVAPTLIDPEDMEQFLSYEVGIDTSQPGPYDQECFDWEGWDNCFSSYLRFEDAYRVGYQAGATTPLWGSDDPLDQRSLSKVGLLEVDGQGNEEGNGVKWIAADDDCQISSPQMIDLKNGRFLVGYAQYQCISDGEGYNRIGGDEALIPSACFLMEINADGEVLSGPTELPNHCWGALDEPVYMGKGRVGWVYKPDPLIDNYGGPQHSRWEMLVYTSDSVNGE